MVEGKVNFVSLLANWYSGATLVTILLNGHSQIVSNGESMFFNEEDERRYECSCGRYVDECEFYRKAARHMWVPSMEKWDKELFVQVPAFSRKLGLRSFFHSWRFESCLRNHIINNISKYRSARDRFLRAQLTFFENARQLAGAQIYMDGTKSVRRAQLFARNVFSSTESGRMKVLHLIRDGRGFCFSYQKYETWSPTLAQSAEAWLSYIEQVDHFAKLFPSVPVLTVRYEDLCRSTSDTVRAICRFLEVPYEDLSNVVRVKDIHVLGNEMRKSFTGSIIESTSWKEKYEQEAQSKLTSLMRAQLQRFGYL